jgi:hypothetical protein
MGQTAPGSYIVTAFTPAEGVVLVSAARQDDPLFRLDSEIASARSIGVTVMAAVEATKEAVEHYRSRASLAAFDDLVPLGVSYEMTSALSELVAGSDGADIGVEWDPILPPPRKAPTRVEFLPSDVDVLSKASTQLGANVEPPTQVTVMGRVHLLTQREAGGPGVVGIENLSTDKPKKLRVHLGDADYHTALRAHDRNDAVVVQGQMEREGNIHWLYNGRLLSTLGSIEDIKEEIGKPPLESDPAQMEFDSDENGVEGKLSLSSLLRLPSLSYVAYTPTFLIGAKSLGVSARV